MTELVESNVELISVVDSVPVISNVGTQVTIEIDRCAVDAVVSGPG